MLHANGDEKIHAWFTYTDALNHVKEEKKRAKNKDNKITCYEIIEDVPSLLSYTK